MSTVGNYLNTIGKIHTEEQKVLLCTPVTDSKAAWKSHFKWDKFKETQHPCAALSEDLQP